MCGIVGYLGSREVVPILLEGLKRLEYRGYDSAGVAVAKNGTIETCRAEGKLQGLVDRLDENPLLGHFGLGHTRWATHGVPSVRNAHPMVDNHQRLALIHNGIIENFLPLRQGLEAKGWVFHSDTDTEVIANLISARMQEGESFLSSVRRVREQLEGHYAFAVFSWGPDGRPEIVAARQGPPLVIGESEDGVFLASDPTALLSWTREVRFLENEDVAHLTLDGVHIVGPDNQQVDRPRQRLNWDPIQAEKAGYKHFMLKEIHEQPEVIQETFAGRVDFANGHVDLDGLEGLRPRLKSLRRIHLLACGTSWHSALIGKFLIEELARIPVDVDYGSEYRYRDPIVDSSVLAVGISQSGETADTLSAMGAAQERGAALMAICNVPGSQATRISDGVLLTHAGPEIGVASTKAFTTQLVVLYLFALYLRQLRGTPVSPDDLRSLAHLPQAIAETLELEPQLDLLARHYHRASDYLYLGRGLNYPIALEGALKLKEISYIHAEGYPAGEMKHGPIALIDEDLPVVALATGDRVYSKLKSNLQEVKARDGKVIVITDRGADEFLNIADEVIQVSRLHETLQPVVNVIPLQLLAYHIGVRLGCDVDQPRNLAKSVTVE